MQGSAQTRHYCSGGHSLCKTHFQQWPHVATTAEATEGGDANSLGLASASIGWISN